MSVKNRFVDSAS